MIVGDDEIAKYASPTKWEDLVSALGMQDAAIVQAMALELLQRRHADQTARHPACRCHLEPGDSACVVHGIETDLGVLVVPCAVCQVTADGDDPAGWLLANDGWRCQRHLETRTFYIASSRDRIAAARELSAALELQGMHNAFAWLDHFHRCSLDASGIRDRSDLAARELLAARTCDVFIGISRMGKGSHVELGAALTGTRKHIVLLGVDPADLVFYESAGVTLAYSIADVLRGLIPGDGGKHGRRQSEPHATQTGAATPGQERPHKALFPAAGNVREPQIGPTPDRSDHPPSPASRYDADLCAKLAAQARKDDAKMTTAPWSFDERFAPVGIYGHHGQVGTVKWGPDAVMIVRQRNNLRQMAEQLEAAGALELERDAYRAMLADLVARKPSSHDELWNRARTLLKQGDERMQRPHDWDLGMPYTIQMQSSAPSETSALCDRATFLAGYDCAWDYSGEGRNSECDARYKGLTVEERTRAHQKQRDEAWYQHLYLIGQRR